MISRKYSVQSLLKTAMEYYHQLYSKLEELAPLIQEFMKKLSKKIEKAIENTNFQLIDLY